MNQPSAGQPYVFVSYTGADRERSLQIADRLEAAGIPVWVDRRSIAGGSNWDAEIVRGIKGAAALAVVCSPASMLSVHVQQELRLALQYSRPILPLLLTPTSFPEEVEYVLAGRQWVEVLERPEGEWLPRLLEALTRIGVTPATGGGGPASQSGSGLDSHLDTVARTLADGRVVLFLGSGVNLCGRGVDDRWRAGLSACLPSDDELAAHLAHSFSYPDGEPRDLVRVSQYVAVTAGLGPLYDELHGVFDLDYAPNSAHRFVAALPSLLRAKGSPRPYGLIVTTTFDDALERAFDAAGEPYDLVSYVAEGESYGRFLHRSPDGAMRLIDRPNEYRDLSPDARTVILRIHGAVDRPGATRDSFVITEDHYIDYLTRTDVSNLLPVTVAAKLRRSHYLFLGYSVRDWNLRVILNRIWGQQKLAYKSWAIGPETGAFDQELWRTREVTNITDDLDRYVGALRGRLQALPARANPLLVPSSTAGG